MWPFKRRPPPHDRFAPHHDDVVPESVLEAWAAWEMRSPDRFALMRDLPDEEIARAPPWLLPGLKSIKGSVLAHYPDPYVWFLPEEGSPQ